MSRVRLEEEEELRRAVLAEIQRQAARLAQIAAFLARRAFRAGVTMRVSTDLYWMRDGVHLTVTFQLIESKLNAMRTRMYMDTRHRALLRVLRYLESELEKKGITCDAGVSVSRRAKGAKGAVPEVITLDLDLVPKKIDLDRLLHHQSTRVIIGSESWTNVATFRTSFLKALEAEVIEDYERGAGDTDLEEAGGAPEEGGGEEGVQPAGAGGLGAGGALEEGEGGGAGEGWVRVIDVVAESGIAFTLLEKLIASGRMEAKKVVGPDGVPYTYVRVEDVKKLKEVLGGKRGVVKGGG